MAPIPLYVTEWMKGYLGKDAPDYDTGFIAGIETEARFVHEMHIKIDDIDRFVSDPDHVAVMDGYVEYAAFGGRRPVTGASFKMFVDSNTPGLKYMKYRIPFTNDKGESLTLYGHKTVHDDRSLDLWGDTTTLYTAVYQGDLRAPEPPADKQPFVRGIIHIEKLDLLKSIMSFRSPGSSPAQAEQAMSTFGRFFMGKLWDVYGRWARIKS